MREGTWADRLLGDEDVRRWLENHGSQATADNYLRTLGRFLAWCDLTPAGYVALNPKERADRLHDFVQERLASGGAPSYVQVTKKAVVSWLRHHGEELGRPLRIKGTSRRPSLKDAHIPSQEELRRVLNVADARARTATALMAFSGLRPQVLGSYDGEEGLRLGDFPEAHADGEAVTFETAPTRIDVPAHLSKVDRPYFTFLGPEGVEYLTAYLGERTAGGEDLGPETPIITPKSAPKDFMRTINVGDLLRKPMRRASLTEPPYIWRSYFSSRAMLAESKGLSHEWREAFLGHSLGVAGVYSLGKQVPPDTVEAMRRGYGQALPFLETRPSATAEDRTSALLRAFLKAAGYAQEEVDGMDLGALGEDEIADLIRDAGSRRTATNGGRPRQRILPLEELPTALEAGWVYRDSLADGRVVVELPG